MSWGAQNRSKDEKTPSTAAGKSRKSKPALCGIQRCISIYMPSAKALPLLFFYTEGPPSVFDFKTSFLPRPVFVCFFFVRLATKRPPAWALRLLTGTPLLTPAECAFWVLVCW
jgi:hypothetical protein